MSLVWFKGPDKGDGTQYEYDESVRALIKEKTGLEMTAETGDNLREVNVRFPDMEAAQTLTTKVFDRSTSIYFVDVENHFFACMDPGGYEYYLNASYPYVDEWIRAMIYELQDGTLASAYGTNVNASKYNYEGFNIGRYFNLDDQTCDTLLIVPAFFYNYYKSRNTICNIKNMYINYTRRFMPGQKIIDNSGNVFVTLGEYLLYYNGKNK